uniref:Uncharacterized protein n=1 Tax=Romanomermis culicivorax TaxID=13658 RepID=A0A915IEE6_ROMCU
MTDLILEPDIVFKNRVKENIILKNNTTFFYRIATIETASPETESDHSDVSLKKNARRISQISTSLCFAGSVADCSTENDINVQWG